MAFNKPLVGAILAAAFVFICCGVFLFYNYNRHPAYPAVRRPAYNTYINQLPQRPTAAHSNTNHRPAPTTSTDRLTSTTAVTGTTCSSSNSYQQYGMCWAADIQRLQISPSLTIENFVRFHKINFYDDDVLYSSSYRQQLCEQSRRFNSVGVLCVTSSASHFEDDDDCFYQRAGGVSTSAAKSCINNDCICVVGDPYESIAANTKSPNDPFDAHQTMFQPAGYPGRHGLLR